MVTGRGKEGRVVPGVALPSDALSAFSRSCGQEKGPPLS